MMVLKFRVWDEVRHKILQADCIEFVYGKAYWVKANSTDDGSQGGNDSLVMDNGNDQLKLDQYTGIKDINGKEICTGDILKIERPEYFESDYRKVKHFIYGICILRDVKAINGITPFYGSDVKVIGNIHDSTLTIIHGEKNNEEN